MTGAVCLIVQTQWSRLPCERGLQVRERILLPMTRPQNLISDEVLQSSLVLKTRKGSYVAFLLQDTETSSSKSLHAKVDPPRPSQSCFIHTSNQGISTERGGPILYALANLVPLQPKRQNMSESTTSLPSDSRLGFALSKSQCQFPSNSESSSWTLPPLRNHPPRPHRRRHRQQHHRPYQGTLSAH